MAIAALILGICGAIGGFCLGFIGLIFAIVGFILARMELGKIERGESSPAGQQYAKIGYWCSIAGFIGFAIYLVLVVALVILNVAMGVAAQ